MKDNTLTLAPDEDFLYLQIADRLGRQIRQQLLKIGEKLPSVRALSQEQGISLSTAYKDALGIHKQLPNIFPLT